MRFNSANIDDLLQAAPAPASPLDSVDELVRLVESRSVALGQLVEIPAGNDYPAVLVKSPEEMGHLVNLATNELKLIRHVGGAGHVLLTVDGWRRAVELRRLKPRSDEAFVAMSFHPSLREAYDQGIKPALEETGYSPVRVDREEYNAKIDDEIIARIRASSLVVADFTLQRTGVYFEAGFALGLGLAVVWTCKADDSENLSHHFDTRQYNHILWTDPDDLRRRLRDRISATVPRRTTGT